MVQKSGVYQLRLVYSFSHYLPGFLYIQTVVVWDVFHQQYVGPLKDVYLKTTATIDLQRLKYHIAVSFNERSFAVGAGMSQVEKGQWGRTPTYPIYK